MYCALCDELLPDMKEYNIFQENLGDLESKVHEMEVEKSTFKAMMMNKMRKVESAELSEAETIKKDDEIIDAAQKYQAVLKKKYDESLDAIEKLTSENTKKDTHINLALNQT